ncbi:MAG: energy transducer TonB [Acidobacteria bacterium]|nr:energy transducer TonB [Acidobacteriota bacterium]
MKFCPICKTRYDEEILRFCIKDGTPLVDEDQPNFTALPSESDFGEETIIRRKNPPPEPDTEYIRSPRIVIPTSEEPPREPVRTKTTMSIRRPPPPQKSNATKSVLLTVLGTIVLLAGAGVIFWFLSNQNAGNENRNANYNTNFNSININLNTNLNVDNSLANFNYNLNANANTNSNSNAVNANLKTPTPTRTPTPTPTPTPNVNANVNVNGAVNVNSNSNARLPVNTTPTLAPTPSASPPRPSPSLPTNRPVNAGILNGRAVNLPKPAYPPIAKQMRATGQVAVQVQVDESGNVTSARAMSGNLLLRASAEAAARQSRFNPVRIGDQAVRATGIVIYNFTN